METEEKFTLKNRKVISSFIILLVVLIVSSISLAWYKVTITGNDDAEGVEVTTANLSIVYNGGPEFKEENILRGWTATKTFTVENTGDATAVYSINWGTLANDFTNSSDIVYSVASTHGGGILSETQIPSSGTNISMLNNIRISVDTIQTYTITFKYLNLAVSQNIDEGSVLSGKIQIHEGETTTVPTFASILKENTPPEVTPETVPGQVAATTNEGLIIGPDDDYGNTTYYYRGAVTNNYVSFAGFTWRIVRINGDGTVRMVLDSYAQNSNNTNIYSYWNTNCMTDDITAENNATAVSYATYGNSTIKGDVETWYNSNIGNNTTYSNKISTSKFCNDITLPSGEASQLFAPCRRLYMDINRSPSMTCSSNSHVYNLSVGLITSDEITYAGALRGDTNQNYYLYNSNLSYRWWTISPGRWYTDKKVWAFNLNSEDGALVLTPLNNSLLLRPVISLTENVTVTTESPTNPGTSSNPYIIE